MENGPLKGTRVIELGQIAAGPFATSLLADLGADVVKVGRPDGGDGMRSWPPLTPAADDPANVYSENFASVNRNKRSIAVEQPELAKDERFISQGQRAANQVELAAILQPEFAKRSAAYWLQEMNRRGVPCSPINTYPEILSDPQVEHLGLVRELTLPNGAKTNTTAFPVRMGGYELEVYREPPDLGADTDDVIAEWLG